jgi:hypothetical protein
MKPTMNLPPVPRVYAPRIGSQAGESNPNDLIGTLTSPGRRAACDLQTRECIGCASANKTHFP